MLLLWGPLKRLLLGPEGLVEMQEETLEAPEERALSGLIVPPLEAAAAFTQPVVTWAEVEAPPLAAT